jgi:starch synthase
LRVAFVTPELQSLVRRTNLASVAEALVTALRQGGCDVRALMPLTVDVAESAALGELTEVTDVVVGDVLGEVSFKIHRGQLGEIPVYLFEQPRLFGTRHPYGDDNGPYEDNWRRYALFARAVLASLDSIGFEPDVLHCVDWTTGLVPVYHQLEYLERGVDHPASRAGTWFGIHNLAMQGAFEREILPKIGIAHEQFKAVGGVELGGKVNYLKAGAEFATIVGTHSPSHAQKIQERDRGFGLEEVFRRRHKELVGITNGIDYAAWDPANDPMIPGAFSARDRELAGKRKCKQALQAALRLDNGPRTPVACTIGRWDADSGFDLLVKILNQILEHNIELVVMGQGEEDVAHRLRTMEESFLGRIRVVDGYQPSTAHLIMGGADILLLPAHYQPSNPLFAIAMRYGVVPFIYSGSGLDDSVIDYFKNARKGTGFHFDPYTPEGLMDALMESIKVYKDPAKWKTLQRRCLNQDFSWSSTAKEYIKAYRRVTRRVKARHETA